MPSAAPVPASDRTAALYEAAGRLVGTVNSALGIVCELSIGGRSPSGQGSFSGAVGRMEQELDRLGILVEHQHLVAAMAWVLDLRRVLTSEDMRARDTPEEGLRLGSSPYWPLHPGDTTGPEELPLEGIRFLEQQVRAALADLDALRPCLDKARDRTGVAPEVDPTDCQQPANADSGSPEAVVDLLDLTEPDRTTTSRTSSADVVSQAMDELVREGLHYRSTAAYLDLIRFVSTFRQYSPFNAMLVHLQMPEATYVARASDWRSKYGRPLRPGARPLVMLQPGGPTMPVYDISDTIAGPRSSVPDLLAEPFRADVRGAEKTHWDQLIDNAKMWGIRVTLARMGSRLAGFVHRAPADSTQQVTRSMGQGKDRREVTLSVPVEFEVEIRDTQDLPARLVTVLHELAHVLCGHVGAQSHQEWPDCPRQATAVKEFEAETAAFVVCRRLDPSAQLPPYLHGYLNHRDEVPTVSLETITRAAGILLAWIQSRERVPKHLRKAT